MDESLAISIRNVSKKYRLYGSQRQRLLEVLHPFKRKYHRDFWALQDVSFDVPAGTTLGIIGRNGSGKSTLLQIICSILRPTSGRVEVNGRIAALLELGAGFNMEFTGRENVVFNSKLRGLNKHEIRRRLPKVEAFADIGEFFDQPVKTYSSGMFVRLAFAAAIHVDPDILIVDEALAVGDAKFQQKCYRKFIEFQQAGKTIVFVSHDMHSILKHCDSAVLLEPRPAFMVGTPNDVVNRYLDLLEGRGLPGDGPAAAAAAEPPQQPPPAEPEQPELDQFLAQTPAGDNCPTRRSYNQNEYRQGPSRGELIDYLIVADGRYDPTTVPCGESVDIYLKARFLQAVDRPVFGMSVKTVDGVTLFGYHSDLAGVSLERAEAGDSIVLKFSFRMNVAPGDVFLDVGVAHKTASGSVEALDRRCAAVHLRVLQGRPFYGLVDLEAATAVVCRQGPAPRPARPLAEA